MEKLFRFRYDQHIGETVEALVNTLPGHERRVLRARYVTWPHLADEMIARRLGLPACNQVTLLLATLLHFGQCWLRWQQGGGHEQHSQAVTAQDVMYWPWPFCCLGVLATRRVLR